MPLMTTTISIRIYYEDTDFSGMVYHANYLKYFERGRTESLRSTGLTHADLLQAEEPSAFTARRLEVDFITPARIDDEIEVRTTVVEAKGARLVFQQEIWRENTCLTKAEVEVVAITLAGRPKRLPAEVINFFKDNNIST